MSAALLALAIGAFGIGTTEFVIVGLLPDVALDLGVSIPSAGLLVSGYALSVVVGAPLVTALGARLPRKALLVGLMVVFILGNVVCAVAADYPVLMVGRAVAALCHGAFFGIGSVVAAAVVAPHRQAAAIALMFSGLTAANVLGVPMGTLLGQHLGWRSTFWAVSALGVVGVLGVALLVPRQPRPETGLRRELAVFRRPAVWLALAVTTFGFGGVFAAFTYLAPMMTEVSGFGAGAVGWLLVLFGVGSCVGNVLGGRAADRALLPTTYATLGLLAVVLVLFAVTVGAPFTAAVTIALLGTVGFATVPALQMRVMRAADGAPALASAANIAAFNLGNALGAWLGGVVVDAGLGWRAPNLVGAGLSVLGLAAALWSGALDRRRAPGTPVDRVPVG
ncbi:MFS transporter [Actinokineospora auranticolor]|uniref:MFS transporter n=1 Tax=Actinokineospora auranticolor TaxID=155976 RepID=UPI000CEBF047|nr:MFS transporter [Actinokineospora auranticolor]